MAGAVDCWQDSRRAQQTRTLCSREDWRRTEKRIVEQEAITPSIEKMSHSFFPQPPYLWVEILHQEEASMRAQAGNEVTMHYSCLLATTGSCLDSSRSRPCSDRKAMKVKLGAGDVVAGMETALLHLTLGTLARVHVPAKLAYGDIAAGPIPSNSSLVFEVELLAINGHSAPGLPTAELRALLLLPVSTLAPAVSSKATECVVTANELAGQAQRPTSFMPPLSASTGSPMHADCQHFERGLPEWFLRLERVLPPAPEHSTFDAFFNEFIGSADAVAHIASTADHGAQLLDGSLPIPRMSYGCRWDSRTPAVLCGSREWAPAAWDWMQLQRELGDAMVLAKSRAPIFESDNAAETVIAECTLREYIQYARALDLVPPEDRRQQARMYMNGWDVFEAAPSLWREGTDGIAGTIDNLSFAEYTRHHARYGLGDATKKVRALCKLFVGPCGAVTRMHQDNHHAHAWLSQIEGYKLYVLCSPDDTEKLQPLGSGAQDGGRTRESRLDPLEAVQRHLAQQAGATVWATVLGPGETLLAPEGWWHYAAALTAGVTLMCNFWDGANVHALRAHFLESAARALDAVRRRGNVSRAATCPRGGGGGGGGTRGGNGLGRRPTIQASETSVLRSFRRGVSYRVRHAPFVYVRARPSTDSEMLGILPVGANVVVRAERDGWLQMQQRFNGQTAWLLEDGTKLGLGTLLSADEAQGEAELEADAAEESE